MAPSSRLRGTLAAVLGFVVAIAADTCSTVHGTTSISVAKPLALAYTIAQSEYWSTACGDLKPSCILLPETTEEVAAIVKILRGNNETFAVKSGGHNPNNYFASVAGGPLISTKELNEITLDAATQTVRVGPGNRWDDVSSKLDGTGYSVVGGRIGNVGVGGYMLGGGLSFMSTEYGWAANSVVQFTLVLANASIVTVDANNYPDLFLSLKGGGNNFGIVTEYTLQVYPQGQVWGGNLFFDANDKTTPALLAALHNFTANYPDEKAGIIMTAERTLATLVDIWVLFLYYNGPEPPAGVFDNFFAISHLIDTTKTQSMNQLLSGNNWAVVKGSVYTIGTETMALPSEEDSVEVMNSYYDSWVGSGDKIKSVPGLIASVAFQPLPPSIARLSKSKGGDLIDVDDDVPRIVLELDYSFLFNSDYATVDTAMRDTYGGFRDLAKKYQNEGKMANTYLPLFQNDAFYPQDYFGRLKPEKVAIARRVRQEVDPDGLWRDRTGGFKL